MQGVEPVDIPEYYMNPPMDKMKALKENTVIEQKRGEKPGEYSETKYWRVTIPMMSDRDNVVKVDFKY